MKEINIKLKLNEYASYLENEYICELIVDGALTITQYGRSYKNALDKAMNHLSEIALKDFLL